jgi:hypothetical protein
MWDVSLALKMTLRSDYYADAERFEIQSEEGIITVTRCSDPMLDEPTLTLYRGGEVRAFHNLESDWGTSFPRRRATSSTSSRDESRRRRFDSRIKGRRRP